MSAENGSVPASVYQVLEAEDALEIAVLIGSRASETAGEHSDWDFALQFDRDLPRHSIPGRTESLRRALAAALKIEEDSIDLVDLPRARLAMRAEVAEHGIVLKGTDSLAWLHFLSRTWRELEEWEWYRRNAA